VCAVVHRNHYDLGVVRTTQGVRAVFAVGQEWDEACSLFLRFVKANSAPAGQESVSLCPKWSEANESAGGQVEDKGAGGRPRGGC
jgi:hypothetical protein